MMEITYVAVIVVLSYYTYSYRNSPDSLWELAGVIITMTIIMVPQEQCRLLMGAGRSVGLEERLWRRRREAEAL